MAKPKFRFHANFLKITHTYEKQKEANVKAKTTIANTRQKDGSGVPPMPRLVFNRDGSPCYAHLEEEPTTTTKKVKGKNGVKVYPMPRINWRKEN